MLLACAGAYLLMISRNQSSEVSTTNNATSGLGRAVSVDGSKSPTGSKPEPPATQSLSGENNYIGHDSKVTDVIFVSGTNHIASVSDDGVLCLFDLATPHKPAAKLKISEHAATSLIHNARDHTLTIVDYGGSFQIRSAANGELINTHLIGGAGLTCVARIPGGQTVIASDWDGRVREFDLSTSPIKTKTLTTRPQVIYDVEVAADGSLFAWGGRDSFVSLWRVKDQVLVDLVGHESGKYVYDIDFSPKGDLLASAGQDNSVVVWDVATGKSVFSYHYIVPQAVRFLPDGNRLAVGGRGGNLLILDLKQQRRVAEMSVGKHVECIAVSADGNLIAAGANDGVLKVWSLSLLPE
jgi:WD40 repeat protein